MLDAALLSPPRCSRSECRGVLRDIRGVVAQHNHGLVQSLEHRNEGVVIEVLVFETSEWIKYSVSVE